MGINKLHSRDQFELHYSYTSIPYKYRIEHLLQSIARINNAHKLPKCASKTLSIHLFAIG